MSADPTRLRPSLGARLLLGCRRLGGNLVGAVCLALPLPAPRRLFHFDLDQLAAVLVLTFAADIVCDYLEAGPDARFWPAGLGSESFSCLTLLAAAYLAARAARAPRAAPALMILLLASGLVLDLPLTLATLLWPAGRAAGTYYYLWLPCTTFWSALIGARSLRLLLPERRLRASLLGMLTAFGVLVPLYFGVTTPFWYTPPPEEEEADTRPKIDVEQVYFDQAGLIRAALDGVAAHRPGRSELYFLGFASWSLQDVFLKEGRFAQHLFDEKFGTGGRSILLANNRATLDELPLASVGNLGIVLDRLATKMDVDEDVLFLFLTSHGSPNQLAVNFYPLGLDGLSAVKLRALLDHSRIKWRVIVISACYSGSFIDALKDDRTLIMTAARPDRTSFGCGDENDFTYFGEAYFGQALQHTVSFTEAFDQAKAAIAERETKEQLTPSEPQIFIGDAIRPKLDRIQAQLAP